VNGCVRRSLSCYVCSFVFVFFLCVCTDDIASFLLARSSGRLEGEGDKNESLCVCMVVWFELVHGQSLINVLVVVVVALCFCSVCVCRPHAPRSFLHVRPAQHTNIALPPLFPALPPLLPHKRLSHAKSLFVPSILITPLLSFFSILLRQLGHHPGRDRAASFTDGKSKPLAQHGRVDERHLEGERREGGREGGRDEM
jgi:hypothetical protein